MNVVKDLNNLVQLMHSREEVIIFPVGVEGQTALDLFRFSNLINRVCCIAATQVEGNNTAQHFIHELPIIPFEHLAHFRETALLIVVTPEQFHAQINSELTRLGFKFVVFVRNDTNEQIRNELKNMYTSGQVMMWYMRHFDRKITEMEYRIEEQNEVCRVNTAAFSEYRNAFRGKEVVIVGNGPTLNYYKPIPDAIHIGLNRAWMREDIVWDYLFTIDGRASKLLDIRIEQGFNKIRRKVFRGKYLERVPYSHLNYPEDVLLSNSNVVNFLFNDNAIGQLIRQDICQHPLYEFGSVVSPAFCFAVFTYPKRIYFVGCDTSPTGHFYSEKKANVDRVNKEMRANMPMLKVGYARMKMFARLYYPETEIISINPVGLRGLFKDVYTEEYKAALAEQEKLKE